MRSLPLLLLPALALASCDQPGAEYSVRATENGSQSNAQEESELSNRATIRVWRDASTGCRYLILRVDQGNATYGGFTARLHDDGTPDCPRARRTNPQPETPRT